MPTSGDSRQPAGSQDAGSVALFPEPFEVNAEAVSRAARAARDALQRLSASQARRPPRPESPPAAPLEPLPVVPKAG